MPTRSRQEILNGVSMSAVPVVNEIVVDNNPVRSRNAMRLEQAGGRVRGVATPSASSKKKQTTQTSPSRLGVQGLIAINALLFGVHLVGLVWVFSSTIERPVTVYETRYKNTTIDDFSCAYEFYNESSVTCPTNHTICSDPSPDPTVSPQSVLIEAGALRPDAYTIVPFDIDGVGTTRFLLTAIEAVTCLFHGVYTASFIRILLELPHAEVFGWVAEHGGLPGRWIEYSLTASLMSFFIANTANVLDLYALLAFALATYALMYFGMMIEKNLAQGYTDRALQLLYIPSTALFSLTVIPTFRQLWEDIARFSCVDPSQGAFLCEKSCFGENVPIPTFIVVLMILFLVFPLVTLQKIYYISGTYEVWGSDVANFLRTSMCVERSRKLTLPLFWIANGIVQLFLFLAYVLLWGWLLALRRVVSDILWPVLPSIYFKEDTEKPSPERLTTGVIVGEYLYAALSASSKLFLLIFFLLSFAEQDW